MKKILMALIMTTSLTAFGFTAEGKGPQIGKKAPNFKLTDIDGTPHKLSDFKGKYVVLEWTNYSCPFVVKHYDSKNMQNLQSRWTAKDIVWLSIASSAKGKEGNMTPAEWKAKSTEDGAAPTAILIDEDGKVGKTYDAKTTPHMFVINPEGNLIYKGAIDSKPTYKKTDVLSAQNYVSAALDESLNGKKVTTPSTEPYGCSVKY